MGFKSGDFEYVAGNLATEPRLGRFPAKDGLYDEVLWMTVAVNHSDAATEYVELEARGKTKEYVKNLVQDPARPLGKGTFVMAGGKPTVSKNGHRKLKLVVFSSHTSLDYDVLDYKYLHQDDPKDEDRAETGADDSKEA
ncbi:hypothetical protein [Bifidobacterium crudilactis]|uniref:hypothetical protein n=1 Tax=Bifidobacterium crudilactis TaxID=327277 RepID=UPI0026480818|nr:hypothetical protein [Bifidobacterium crudilactis]MDN5973519.1 hypothetical protein [Bifidobacterium crudilactis]MDN6001720.1 hypothetical protein [Bifidobacterium crudilactis]MDN6210314.1 hypothetical protein [Bifidobacterium crudilactis]MDN6468296.1 hypothetical protein [Bifidobacterium crudilactis]MDN6773409.1 hypothetical protein [Bifidobacterium crudilactis]